MPHFYNRMGITLAFAIFLFGIGHPAVAYDCLEEVTTASSSITEAELKALEKKAYQNIEDDDWEQAVVDYSEVINLSPDDVDVGFKYRMRGLAYAFLGEWEKALCDADKFIEHNPEHPNSFTERGGYFMEIGEFENALADFNEALTRHPDRIYDNNSVARALIGLGRCSEALASAEIVRQLDPTDEYTKTFVAEIKNAGSECKTTFACKLTNSGCIDASDSASDVNEGNANDDRKGEFKP